MIDSIAVSIVIPVYNVEAYLKRCVDSARAQTMHNIEIILVDDGSPDNCPHLCDKFAEEDDRIKVIHKRNGGLASARNAGMKIAKGKYLFFLDSDDWIERSGIELLYTTAEENKVDFVRFKAIRTGWPGLPEHVPGTLEPGRELNAGYYDKNRILDEVYPRILGTSKLTMGPIVGAWESMYDRAFLENNQLYFYEEVKFGEDQIFSACVTKAANSFYYIDTPCVYHYCFNPASISRSFRKGRWESCKMTIQLAEKVFAKETEYDFSKQLKWLTWFCILLALNERKYISSYPKRVKYCRKILGDPEIKWNNLQMKNLNVSIKQKVFLVLVKLKAASILSLI